MDFSFEDRKYKNIMHWFGLKSQFTRVLVLFAICWLPLAVMTLINGTFWTGEITTSFITNFDTQIRFLVSMPIFILAEKLISSRLRIILNQFINSGIVAKEEKLEFESIFQTYPSLTYPTMSISQESKAMNFVRNMSYKSKTH